MAVQCEELTGVDGARIGIATLDAAKALNALSLPMIDVLDQQLARWADNPEIVCVLLRGAGTKAFCAGGDVRSLMQACRDQPGTVPTLAANFFEAEYRLDYRLHTYPKPVLGSWSRAGRRHGPVTRCQRAHRDAEQPPGHA